jgi:tetratricopeptide (TPR) repeat protein
MKLPIGIALAVAAALTFQRPAQADNVDDAKRHFAAGTKAYEIGAYDEAIKEYGEAYRLIDDPALLFNLAQAHRFAGHTVEALRAYRMFLLKLPNTPNRSEVESRIADLQSQMASQPKPTRQPASPEPAVSEPVPSGAPPSGRPQSTVSSPAQATAPGARKKLIAGGIVAGVGVLGGIGGIVCGVLAQNAGNSVTHAAQTQQAFDYNTYRTGQSEQAAEIALLAIGGAAVVAGTTVMIVGKRQSIRAHAWLQPFAGPRASGLSFAGAF